MSPEENKELVRQWTDEGFGKGNFDLVNELFGSDYFNHSPLADRASVASHPLINHTGDVILMTAEA